MSAECRLSPRAASDLDEILDYYVHEAGVMVAERMAREFERAFCAACGKSGDRTHTPRSHSKEGPVLARAYVSDYVLD